MSELVVGSIAGLAANSYVVDVAAGSTLDLTNATSLPSSALPAGSVLQVVSTTKTDTFTTTSTSFTDLTGLSATITPSSTSSKIYVVANVTANGTDATASTMFRLMRDATPIGVGDTAGSRPRATFVAYASQATASTVPASATVLDSPNTTSSVTYKVQMALQGAATGYVNRSQTDSDTSVYPRTISTLTLLEVAG